MKYSSDFLYPDRGVMLSALDEILQEGLLVIYVPKPENVIISLIW